MARVIRDVVVLLNRLIQLHYDAIDACKAAVAHVADPRDREQLAVDARGPPRITSTSSRWSCAISGASQPAPAICARHVRSGSRSRGRWRARSRDPRRTSSTRCWKPPPQRRGRARGLRRRHVAARRAPRRARGARTQPRRRAQAPGVGRAAPRTHPITARCLRDPVVGGRRGTGVAAPRPADGLARPHAVLGRVLQVLQSSGQRESGGTGECLREALGERHALLDQSAHQSARRRSPDSTHTRRRVDAIVRFRRISTRSDAIAARRRAGQRSPTHENDGFHPSRAPATTSSRGRSRALRRGCRDRRAPRRRGTRPRGARARSSRARGATRRSSTAGGARPPRERAVRELRVLSERRRAHGRRPAPKGSRVQRARHPDDRANDALRRRCADPGRSAETPRCDHSAGRPCAGRDELG